MCTWKHKALHWAGAQKLLSLPSPLKVLLRNSRSIWSHSKTSLKQVLLLAEWFLQWKKLLFTWEKNGGGHVSILSLFSCVQRGNLSPSHQEANVLLLCNSYNRESKGRLLWSNFGSYLTASAFSLPRDHATLQGGGRTREQSARATGEAGCLINIGIRPLRMK